MHESSRRRRGAPFDFKVSTSEPFGTSRRKSDMRGRPSRAFAFVCKSSCRPAEGRTNVSVSSLNRFQAKARGDLPSPASLAQTKRRCVGVKRGVGVHVRVCGGVFKMWLEEGIGIRTIVDGGKFVVLVEFRNANVPVDHQPPLDVSSFGLVARL